MDYSHLARPKFKQLRKLWLLTISRCRSVLLRVSMISVKYYNLAPMLSNFHLVSTRRFLAGFYSTSNPVNVFLNKFMDASYAWNRVPGKFKTKFSPTLFCGTTFHTRFVQKTRCSRVYRTIFTQTMITSKHDWEHRCTDVWILLAAWRWIMQLRLEGGKLGLRSSVKGAVCRRSWFRSHCLWTN
jgi:hypothetical protein